MTRSKLKYKDVLKRYLGLLVIGRCKIDSELSLRKQISVFAFTFTNISLKLSMTKMFSKDKL